MGHRLVDLTCRALWGNLLSPGSDNSKGTPNPAGLEAGPLVQTPTPSLPS